MTDSIPKKWFVICLPRERGQRTDKIHRFHSCQALVQITCLTTSSVQNPATTNCTVKSGVRALS